MKQLTQLKEEVEKLFQENERLLLDVHRTKQVLRLLTKSPWKSHGITAKQIAKELMITNAAVSGKVRKLREHGLIRSERGKGYYNPDADRTVHDGRTKLLSLTEMGEKIASYIQSFELPSRPRGQSRTPISIQDRSHAIEFHSARLRELVKRIIEHLPQVHAEDICFLRVPGKKYYGEELPFESEILFPDLKNHPKDFEGFNRSYPRFKKSCEEFQRLKAAILEEIELDISKNFSLEFSPRWERPNSFSLEMVEWMFRAGLYLGSEDRRRHFERYFLDFKSKVEKRTLPDGQKTLEYWVAGEGLIQVTRKHAKAEIFRREIDERLRTYMEKLGDAPYYGEIERARNLMNRAMTFREDLMKVLRKNLEMGIFPGDCEFLDAALGTD